MWTNSYNSILTDTDWAHAADRQVQSRQQGRRNTEFQSKLDLS